MELYKAIKKKNEENVTRFIGEIADRTCNSWTPVKNR